MENPSLYSMDQPILGFQDLASRPRVVLEVVDGAPAATWGGSGELRSRSPLSGMPKDQPYTQRGAPVYDSEVIKLVYIVYSYCFTRALGFMVDDGGCKGLRMPVIDKIYVHQGHSLATLRAMVFLWL